MLQIQNCIRCRFGHTELFCFVTMWEVPVQSASSGTAPSKQETMILLFGLEPHH